MNTPTPWNCDVCGADEVRPSTVEHVAKVKHEGVLHEFHVHDMPCYKCAGCGEVTIGKAGAEAISAGLRKHLGLLSHEAIAKNREELGIAQSEMANLLGCAAETVCRWGKGIIQSRMSDKFIRAFYALPDLRVFLRDLLADPTLGEQVVWGESSAPVMADSYPVLHMAWESVGVVEQATSPPSPVTTHRNKSPPDTTTVEERTTSPPRKRTKWQVARRHLQRSVTTQKWFCALSPLRPSTRFTASFRS